ncbi:hypothetical protein QBC46DRAFT_316699 [Diplogelasinospora grovesii]|uniref:DUF7702 domain-containing protein n=1 Tax=Diplogelasinospora grovesii TaxID=303347 RepID=A0AAN6N522_9PEZI|nr:hypothetical protein QBC46DRAFT_316699 [Diplogelasinospora grovesii]
MTVTATDGIAIWKLVFYSFGLVGSIWVSARHGLSKNSGWIFLAIFSAIRIVNSAATIATITSDSAAAVTTAEITAFLGLSPLLLASLGLVSRIYYSILKAPWNFIFTFFILKVAQTPAAVALVLCIVGGTSADTPSDIESQGTVQAGVILYLLVLVLLALLVIRAAVMSKDSSILLRAVSLSLPLLLIRIIYSLLGCFMHDSDIVSLGSQSTGAVILQVFMVTVEEMAIVLIYLWAGFKLAREEDAEEGRKGIDNLAHRAGRGDFGGKLGLTMIVAKKVQKEKSKPPRPLPGDRSGKSAGRGGHEDDDEAPPPPLPKAEPQFSLAQPDTDVAMAYFMTCFVMTSPFEYLPGLYQRSNANQVLASAVLASSFASLALRFESPSLMKRARTAYAEALRKTNAALASPEDAILDTTLVSVLLLGLFEALVFLGRLSPESWTAHALGAIELIRLRGASQFRSPVGQQLYLQTSSNIRASYTQRHLAVPEELVGLHQELRPYLDLSHPNVRICPIADKVSGLRARNKASQRQPETVDPAQLLRDALELDAEAAALSESLPEGWYYHVVRSPAEETPPCAYRGIAHRYPHHAAARHWNALRMIRICANETVFEQAARLRGGGARASPHGAANGDDGDGAGELDIDELQQTAAANVVVISEDILASVPHFLDFSNATTLFSLSSRFLIWPLSVVGVSSLARPAARRFAADTLEELGREAKIPQALQAAKIARESRFIEDWLHIYNSG